MTDAGVSVVLATAPDSALASSWARTVVKEGLAACVNLLPGLLSVYRWEEAIEEASEVLMVAKTGSESASMLAARLEDLHPYEVPEILILPVTGGSTRYLDWVLSESSP